MAVVIYQTSRGVDDDVENARLGHFIEYPRPDIGHYLQQFIHVHTQPLTILAHSNLLLCSILQSPPSGLQPSNSQGLGRQGNHIIRQFFRNLVNRYPHCHADILSFAPSPSRLHQCAVGTSDIFLAVALSPLIRGCALDRPDAPRRRNRRLDVPSFINIRVALASACMLAYSVRNPYRCWEVITRASSFGWKGLGARFHLTQRR